jgi:hypothetical protein
VTISRDGCDLSINADLSNTLVLQVSNVKISVVIGGNAAWRMQ